MPAIKVIKPGFQSTIQDKGRFGFSHYGISISGAADSVALRIGNLLVGNDENTAAIEMTLIGGEFLFERDAVIAITGADFQPMVDSSQVPMWSTIKILAGQILSFKNTANSARCYLCIHGGLDVPPVLQSSSTHLLTSMGGLNGRALIKNDIIQYRENKIYHTAYFSLKKEIIERLYPQRELYITIGPQSNYFSDESIKIFSSSTFAVQEDSNRMGLRLSGPKIERLIQEDIITEGVSLGAIQIAHDSQPIILFVEHQTTGGYPKIANIISADLHRIGQLKPRDKINFSFVSVDEAYKLRKEIETLISANSFVRI